MKRPLVFLALGIAVLVAAAIPVYDLHERDRAHRHGSGDCHDAAFYGFVAGSVVGLQQFGFGLAFAISLDATIVWALLVPSLMAVLGRWSWELPQSLARGVRVKSSPPAEPRRAALRPGR
jgi:uncharacterized membrane protein YdfJ with MMPL/SSD domain